MYLLELGVFEFLHIANVVAAKRLDMPCNTISNWERDPPGELTVTGLAIDIKVTSNNLYDNTKQKVKYEELHKLEWQKYQTISYKKEANNTIERTNMVYS